MNYGKNNKTWKKLNNFLTNCKALREKGDEAQDTVVELSDIAETEHQILTLLRKSRSLLGNKLADSVKTEIETLSSELKDKRRKLGEQYIDMFNEKYGYSMDSQKLFEKYPKLFVDKATEKIVFVEIAESVVPGHPKNEFVATRLMKRHFVIHCGETNTGKTYSALEDLNSAGSGVYLAPLRLLALEVFQKLNGAGTPCTLYTGEEEIVVPHAKHISSTIEKLNIDIKYDTVVIDEAQMIADSQRGSAWTKAILGARADRIHLCCAANAVNLIIRLIEDCGDSYELIKYERSTPLLFDNSEYTFPDSISKGDALVVFSKRAVLGILNVLAEKGVKVSAIYGSLPPETRRKQMQMFIDGESDVVVATDAIGMGLNLPIKRIVFMETNKYDGHDRRRVSVNEIKQIAGRAGRKNIYDVGYVSGAKDTKYVEEALIKEVSDLTMAFYLPLDKYIIAFPIGSLEDRLKVCLGARRDVDYFCKSDIEEPLNLLQRIAGKYELSVEEQYKLIFIPFDSLNTALLNQWLGYIKAYTQRESIPIPKKSSNSLDGLELYYKSLDLYYSFCKTMKMEFEAEKVTALKYKTAEKIDELLRTKMKEIGHKCTQCGKKLTWDYPYSLCELCYYLGDY